MLPFFVAHTVFGVCAALYSAVAVNTAPFRWLHPAVGLFAALYSAVVAGVCAALCSAVGVYTSPFCWSYLVVRVCTALYSVVAVIRPLFLHTPCCSGKYVRCCWGKYGPLCCSLPVVGACADLYGAPLVPVVLLPLVYALPPTLRLG